MYVGFIRSFWFSVPPKIDRRRLRGPYQCGRYRRHWSWENRIPSFKFVHPDCTATTNRIQVGEMLLHEGVEAYKKEGPKFMQRLVAKQKARVQDS